MNWQKHISDLQSGKEVSFRPKGNSMVPIIFSGEQVTISPRIDNLQKGDIVFCRLRGNFLIHKILTMKNTDMFQIGNNRGHINGWINRKAIFGKIIFDTKKFQKS